MDTLIGKNLSEIWDIMGQHDSGHNSGHTLNLREDGAAVHDVQARDKKDFTISGRMGTGKDAIFYGWYVLAGIAKVWSATGQEKPEDIYGKQRWILGGCNYPHSSFIR